VLRGERADVTDFFLMALVDTSAVKHNMRKLLNVSATKIILREVVHRKAKKKQIKKAIHNAEIFNLVSHTFEYVLLMQYNG
jgi:hypothetical protein